MDCVVIGAIRIAHTTGSYDDIEVHMPVKNRNWKHEWQLEKTRQKKDGGVLEARLERQRARRKLDKEGVERKGKDVSHRKALSRGGSNKDGYFLAPAAENRAFARSSNHKPKNKTDRPGK